MSEVQAPGTMQIQDYYGEAISTSALVLQGDSLTRMMKLADIMAIGKATIPKHLAGNSSDCLAVVMQSMQWGMNPFAVAQKTHLTQGGTLGYEAQLINAVVISKAPVTGRPEYEFLGDWNKILGKVREEKGNSGGKYYVAAWKKEDEDELGVIVRLTLKGEELPREVKVMMSQAYPRFSTQWATDPQQQITYLAIRKWARRYTPDVILGVYANDELDPELYSGEARETNPDATSSPSPRSSEPKASRDYSGIRPAKPCPEADQALVDLLTVAKTQNFEAYEIAWKALSPVMRAKVGKDAHEQLKAIAATVDAEFTDILHEPTEAEAPQ